MRQPAPDHPGPGVLHEEARSNGSTEGAEFILIGMTPVRGQAQISGPDGSSLVEILIGKDGTQALALPDAGSRTARALGARWWSVLPTHVQYFTRRSMAGLLARVRMGTRPCRVMGRVMGRALDRDPGDGRSPVGLEYGSRVADISACRIPVGFTS